MADVGRLASTISHELRNPLAAIKLAAYNLRRKTNDASLLPHLNNINKKIEEGDNIIQNLLSFSRARTTKYEVFALSELLDECIVATQSQSNDITVKKAVKLGAKDLIEADPTQLRIVLNNILDNAFQAMSEQSGKITVSACIMGPSYIVSVQDSGMGIEPENLEKVFEPFFTTKSKGTGLGLAVCKDIIESHHGHIELRSAPQKGTTFTITIPSHQPLSAAGIAENKVSY
jgi:signal transduction histidine kinase